MKWAYRNRPTDYRWFAWRPVVVNTGYGFRWVWLEYVLKHRGGRYGNSYYLLERDAE